MKTSATNTKISAAKSQPATAPTKNQPLTGAQEPLMLTPVPSVKPDATKASAPKVASTPKRRTAARPAPAKKKSAAKPSAKPKLKPAPRGSLSGLDAAAKVLAESGKPMRCVDMVERARVKGYWKSGGKTPAATIHSAIVREIAGKGKASRFKKTGRGLFAATKPVKH